MVAEPHIRRVRRGMLLLTSVSLAAGCGGGSNATSNDGAIGGMALGGLGGSGGAGSGGGGTLGGSSGGVGAAGSGVSPDGGSASGGTAGHFASGAWVPLASTDNAITLTGMTVGGPCSGNSGLVRKKVPLLVDGGNSDFQIGDAYITSNSADLTGATLFAPVTNVGTTFHCGISSPLNGYDWLDANGRSLNVSYGVSFIGSEGDVGTEIYDDTCLAPGETGFIIDTQSLQGIPDLYGTVATVTLALVSTRTGTAPGAIVLAQSYTYQSQLLDVPFSNVGTTGAEIQGSTVDFGTVILFDADGLPLWAAYLEELVDQAPANSPGYLAVGATGQGLEPFSSTETIPCGTTIRAILKFAGPTAPSD